jgi:putative PIN family toxin of toxin-antitoxin system
MRWVLDTNVLVSALIWQGTPRDLLEQGFAAGVRFHGSSALLAELRAVLYYPKLLEIARKRKLDPAALFDAARAILCVSESPPLPAPVSRDPDDDAVLACALAAKAGLIVSGDKDLLTFEHFHHIPIVSAAQALARLRGGSENK